MPENYGDQSAEISKELTLSIIQAKVMYSPEDAKPVGTGEHYGKLFKTILKNVRQAMYDKKYD